MRTRVGTSADPEPCDTTREERAVRSEMAETWTSERILQLSGGYKASCIVGAAADLGEHAFGQVFGHGLRFGASGLDQFVLLFLGELAASLQRP